MIVLDDLKYTVRLLLKTPGFTVLTILVMAVGLGLSVYLFAFLHAQIFRDLPFKNGETLVQIFSSKNNVRNQGRLDYFDYSEIKNNVTGLTEFVAFSPTNVNVSTSDGARRYSAVLAESNIFQLTRTKPEIGREFSKQDNLPGSEDVVVIGYDIWQNVFAGSSSVIDKTIKISGENFRIIGVMPKGFVFPHPAQLWLPLKPEPVVSKQLNNQQVFGLAHLKPGVSTGEINQELSVIMQRIGKRYPQINDGIGSYAEYIPLAIAGDGIGIAYSLHTIAILLLFLASVNVGNLLLSKAIEREKETAIRLALGASNGRLISQMFWESLLICGIGGVIGFLLLAWGLEITESVTSTYKIDPPPFWWNFEIDGFLIGLSAMFLLFTIIITGFLPVWRNTRADFNAVLRDGTRGALGKKAGQLNKLLVICEIFIALTVLVAAGVMTYVNHKATKADYGAETQNVLAAHIILDEAQYLDNDKQIQFVDMLHSRLSSHPGVAGIAISTAIPGESASSRNVALEGKEYSENTKYPKAKYISLLPGSLDTLNVELKSGRYFDSSDNGYDKKTVIVTDSFVTQYFDGESPLGKNIQVVDDSEASPEWLTIIGVVEHTYQGSSLSPSGKEPTVFRPYTQLPARQFTVALKMKENKSANTATDILRDILKSLDQEVPAFNIETYEDKVARHTRPLQVITTVFLIFGIAAAILASSGIYGVISNTVNQRTQEIGVKRALGATDRKIAKEFMLGGFRQFLYGAIPGLIAGCMMGFGMTTVLPVAVSDVFSIATMLTFLILSVVLLATWLPMRKALKLEPANALHSV